MKRRAFIAGLGGVAASCARHVFPNVGLISISSAKYDG
jgi:hypothetical protein